MKKEYYKKRIKGIVKIHEQFLKEINPNAHKFYPKVIALIERAKEL